MSGVSKIQVSRLCGELDERVGAFLNRPIEGDWPYLWIDATYVKTREGGRIVSVAVIIAVGVNTEGQREVLGLKVGASEAEPFWTEFLRSLNRRGLRGVKLVISDTQHPRQCGDEMGLANAGRAYKQHGHSLHTRHATPRKASRLAEMGRCSGRRWRSLLPKSHMQTPGHLPARPGRAAELCRPGP